MNKRSKRSFTLVEMMVAVAIVGVVFFIFYSIYRNIQRTHELIRWKTRTDRDLTKVFETLNIDIKKATYPSRLRGARVILNPDASDRTVNPMPQQNFRYLMLAAPMSDISIPPGTSDGNYTGASHIESAVAPSGRLGQGLVIAKWAINTTAFPEQGVDGKALICTLKLYKELFRENGNSDGMGVLTYRRDGLLPIDEKSVPTEGEIILMRNVEWVEFSHKRKYTPAEIDKMNTIFVAGTASGANKLLENMDPDYFYTWMNPSELNIKIKVRESRNISYMFDRIKNIIGGEKAKSYFQTTSEFKVSPVNVAVELAGSIEN